MSFSPARFPLAGALAVDVLISERKRNSIVHDPAEYTTRREGAVSRPPGVLLVRCLLATLRTA